MAETQLTTSEADALSGTTDSALDFAYLTIGESTYYTTAFRCWEKLVRILKALNALRVYKDGDLTFGVRAGKIMDGDAARDYAGASAQALANNQTNYVYLTADATLTVNTSGFPDPSATPHIPLATVVTAGGTYAHGDITDCRGRAIFGILDGVAPADRQDLMPNLNISAAAEAGDTRAITIQARDAGNNDLAERFLVRFWIDDAEYGAPDATGNTVSVTTGTTVRTLTANADYEVISDAGGKVVFDLTVAGAATRYVMAEIDGRIYSSGAVAFTA